MEQQKEGRDYIEYRRKRVKRIKRFLLTLLILLLIAPNVLCAFLLYQVRKMDLTIQETQEKLWELTVQMEDANAAAVVEQALSPVQVDDVSLKEVIPDSQMYEGSKLVYLTFDDGPSEYTDEILDIWKQYDVKAHTDFEFIEELFKEEGDTNLAAKAAGSALVLGAGKLPGAV